MKQGLLLFLMCVASSTAFARKELKPAKVVFHGYAMKRALPEAFKEQIPTGLEFDVRVVMQENQVILSFKPEEAELKRFEGQLKTDMKPTGNWLKRTSISDDGKQIHLRVGTPILPKKGARFFNFEAVAPVYTGSHPKSVELPNLDATKPNPFKKDRGSILEVKMVRAGIYTRVEILMNFMKNQVSNVVFKDMDNTVVGGEQVEVRPGENDQQHWFVYKVRTDSTKISIFATYFSELLKQSVPIQLKVPVWF